MLKLLHRSFRLPLITLLIISFGGLETMRGEENFGLILHGGAGTIVKAAMPQELEAKYREKLTEALKKGYNILEKGGGSIDAVTEALVILENSPLFNAGKGTVFTNSGHNELDASIMDGRTLQAGAVSGVKTVKNPILLAREVMDNSRHVLLSGEGAASFAQAQGLQLVEPDYFFTEKRWQSLLKTKAREAGRKPTLKKAKKHGTVGAAALDKMAIWQRAHRPAE